MIDRTSDSYALAVEGRAAQMHMEAAQERSNLGVIPWHKMRESVREVWREAARAQVDAAIRAAGDQHR